MVRILVTDGIEASARDKLCSLGFEVVEQFYAPDELGIALRYFDILVLRSATKVRKPVIDQALLNHPRVSLSPHIGASTVEAQKRIGEEVVSIINNFPFSSTLRTAS
jgi:lactate dehydrogenase-like 2-hydroxyacid dehydrogenase